MYIVHGIYSDHKSENRGKPPAELKFETLDEAMRKLRDWVEADEIDTDGPMFIEYGIRIEPLPRAEWQDEADAEAAKAAAMNSPSMEFPPPTFKFPRR
jgi:hypothetical protein